MMRAGDQRVDVCLPLKSWQILSSFAFTQTLVFPSTEDLRSTPAPRFPSGIAAEQRNALLLLPARV